MKVAKIIAAVVLLAAAGVIFWKYSFREEGVVKAKDVETRTMWMCSDPDCRHVFYLTAAEAKDAKARGPLPWPPAICPKCGKQQAYGAQECPTCQTKFFGPEVAGSTGACPKCYPEVKPPDPFLPQEEGSNEPPKPRPPIS